MARVRERRAVAPKPFVPPCERGFKIIESWTVDCSSIATDAAVVPGMTARRLADHDQLVTRLGESDAVLEVLTARARTKVAPPVIAAIPVDVIHVRWWPVTGHPEVRHTMSRYLMTEDADVSIPSPLVVVAKSITSLPVGCIPD